jgi:hypothetical protein
MIHNKSTISELVFLFSYGFRHSTLLEYAEFVVVGTGDKIIVHVYFYE